MFGLVPYGKKNNSVGRSDLWDLANIFDNFFNDPLFPLSYSSSGLICADIKNTDKEYIIEAELPGVKKEDIKLELKDDVLTVSVENRSELKEEKENYIRKERRYGIKSRSFYVKDIDNSKVEAKYNDGILKIVLPKVETKEEKHNIEIQ